MNILNLKEIFILEVLLKKNIKNYNTSNYFLKKTMVCDIINMIMEVD